MTTVVDRRGTTISHPGQLLESAWDALVAALSDVASEAAQGCTLCGGLAGYEGQACADSHVIKLCRPCLDAAIRRLSRVRDNAKLATGYEPICNRCWRPILDPQTHMSLRPLWD